MHQKILRWKPSSKNKDMEKTTSEKIRLGVFVIISTVLFVVAAYLIGNRQNMFGTQFTIHAVFRNVNGLQQGNNVRYSGINAGTVKRIKMVNDTTISVAMTLQESIIHHVRTNAIATIGSDGLVGSMIVNIVPGNTNAALVRSGDTITSYSRIGAEDMLSTLNVTNQNAALLTADLLKVTASLNDSKGTLGRLLNDTVMANSLESTIMNLQKTSSEAHTTILNLNSLFSDEGFNNSTAGILLTDEQSGTDVRETINNLKSTSEKLDVIVHSLDSVINSLTREDGTIHYLTTDTTLVKNIDKTVKNLEQGTQRFNENMEALKHSFLTRGYFKKQEKEQKKNNLP